MDDNRKLSFESLVLRGIWLIIILLIMQRKQAGGMGSGYDFNAHNIRGEYLTYFDMYGREGDEAKKYRRDVTFPDIFPGYL